MKIETYTTPESIPVKRVVKLLGYSQPHISNMIKDGRLDHGYAFDRGGGKDDSGELLVVQNQKYFDILSDRKKQIKEMGKRKSLSLQDAAILTERTEPELIAMIASGFLTFEIEPETKSGNILKDENLESLVPPGKGK